MSAPGDPRATGPDDDPVEAYLDAVLSCAPGSPRQIRRTLAEVEAHLTDSAAELQAAGRSATEARAEAVRRMGPPAGAVDRPWPAGPLPPRAVRRRLLLAVLQLGGLAGLFVGLAGAFAAAIRGIWGTTAIATPFPSGSYSQADCDRWLRAYPASPSCLTAMTTDHATDFLRNAVVAGLLGLLVLAARQLLRRRWPAVPSSATEPLLGAGLAGLCALGFAGAGFDAVTVTHGQGAGQPLSLALAAGCAAVLLTGTARRSAGRPFWQRRLAS